MDSDNPPRDGRPRGTRSRRFRWRYGNPAARSGRIPVARPGLRVAFRHGRGDDNHGDATATPLMFRMGDDCPPSGDPCSAVCQRGADARVRSHWPFCSGTANPPRRRCPQEGCRTASTAERADRGRLTRRQSAVQLSSAYPGAVQRPDTAGQVQPTARPRDQDESPQCAQTR